MDLFVQGELRVFLQETIGSIRDEISNLSDEDVSQIDIDEWSEYFQKKYFIEDIKVDIDNVELGMKEIKIKEYNSFYKYANFGEEYILVDGYRCTFKIPFYGAKKLLELKPSSYILSSFPIDCVTMERNSDTGYLLYSDEYNRTFLANQEDVKNFIYGQFKRNFKKYLDMIDNINSDLLTFNNGLEQIILKELNERKERAKDFERIKKELEIPLELKKDAPNLSPIKLRKMEHINKHTAKNICIEPEYYISDYDYNNILKIIYNTCSSMEVAARTFNKNSEEELRDFIIATLGTHYENSVSGETFRKKGKTDIHVLFENKSAFIGECKIWHGKKKLTEAMKQVFGYSTWKDNKIALIFFNKENKDFSNVIKTIDEWVNDNTKQSKKTKGNTWSCVFYRNDINLDVKLTIHVYDITV